MSGGNLLWSFHVVPVLPTVLESQSYFKCGSRAAQFHPVLIVVSPLNAFDQIADAKKHNNAPRKTYSFLEVKLQQSLKKTWTKINVIFLFKKQHTVTVCLPKLGPPRRWKPIRRQNWNNRFQHFQIQPIKSPVQNNEISTCSLTGDVYTTTVLVKCQAQTGRTFMFLWL